jgi:hypothetical protein
MPPFVACLLVKKLQCEHSCSGRGVRYASVLCHWSSPWMRTVTQASHWGSQLHYSFTPCVFFVGIFCVVCTRCQAKANYKAVSNHEEEIELTTTTGRTPNENHQPRLQETSVLFSISIGCVVHLETAAVWKAPTSPSQTLRKLCRNETTRSKCVVISSSFPLSRPHSLVVKSQKHRLYQPQTRYTLLSPATVGATIFLEAIQKLSSKETETCHFLATF